MATNVCAEFKLVPPLTTNADLADHNQLRELLESMHQANVVLLHEVAKLRAEVNTLRGL